MAFNVLLIIAFCVFSTLAPLKPISANEVECHHCMVTLLTDSLSPKSNPKIEPYGAAQTKPFANYESMYPTDLFPATGDTLEMHDSLKCKIPAAVFNSFSKDRQDYFLKNPQLYIITDK